MPHDDDEHDVPDRLASRDDDGDFDDRPRRRREDDFDGTELLVPTDVSGYSIVACYAGFIGMCLPFIGLLFAVPAVVCGVLALRSRKKKGTYGSITGDIRAILGLVFGGIAILLYGGLLIFFAISGK